MADLYTSLVRAKMAMNDGRLPGMTPIPDAIKHIINPDYTIGMGGLTEDAHLGLRCPVCGEHFHSLGMHLNRAHKDVGGAEGVKQILEIPRSAKLFSQRRRRAASETMKRSWSTGKLARSESMMSSGAARVRGRKSATTRTLLPSKSPKKAKRRQSVGILNLKNKCEKQICDRLWALHAITGRSPSIAESNILDKQLYADAVRLFGSWDAAKAAAQMDRLTTKGREGRRKYDVDEILARLKAWFDMHGSLPTPRQIQAPNKLPLMPHYDTILKAFNTRSWTRAMEIVASQLNIRKGRYCLPPEAA